MQDAGPQQAGFWNIIPLPFFLVDSKTGMIQTVNSAGRTLLGCGSALSDGFSLYDILSLHDVTERDEHEGYPCRAELHDLNGCTKDVYLWTIPLHCRNRSVNGIIMTETGTGTGAGAGGFFTRPPMCNEDILKHLSEGIAFVDPAGIIVYWNRGAENLLGIPASEACGRPVWEVQWRLLPEDARTHDALSGIEKSVKKLIERGGQSKEDVIIITPDGDRRVISTEAWCIRSPDGPLFLVVMQDITSGIEFQVQKRRLDHDLSGWVRELRSLFRLAEVLKDPSLSLDRLCRALLDIIPGALQYPAKVRVRVCVREICVFSGGWKEQSRYLETPIRVKGQAEGQIGVYYSDKKRGMSRYPFLPQEIELLEVIAGRIGEFIERMDAYASLGASEKNFREIIERISDVIYSLDERGVITYISPSIEKISGYPPSEMTGKELKHFIVPDDIPGVMESFEAAPHGSVRSFQFRIISKSGEERWLRSSCDPMVENGVFLGTSGVLLDITGQKHVEEALEKSRSLLSNAMDLARMASWEFDVRTNMFTFDDRFYALYGTTAEREGGYLMPAEVYSREFVHPDDMDIVAEEVRKAVGTPDPGYISHAEHRIIRRDGAVRSIIVRISITKDSAGRTIRTHGANQDITERKQAEDAMRESEKRYRDLFNNANDIIVVHEYLPEMQPGILLDVNDPACSILGYTREELLTRTIADITVPPSPEEKAKIGDDIARTGRTTFSGMLKTKNGDTIPAEVSSHIFTKEKRRLNISIIRNITERKKNEQLIQESEQRYGHIIANINDALFSLDADGTITFMSPVITRMTGYTPGDLLGHSYERFIYPDDLAAVKNDFLKTLSGESRTSMFRVLISGGDVRYMKTSTRVSRDGTEICGVSGILTDITAEKKLEEIKKERFVEIEQNLEYLAILNDKIRNPLSVITGIVDAMDTPEKDMILQCIWEIDGIIQQLDRGWLQSEKIRRYLIKHYGFPGTGR